VNRVLILTLSKDKYTANRKQGQVTILVLYSQIQIINFTK
jgi:hypothetical protein